jgi:hypothetical protein
MSPKSALLRSTKSVEPKPPAPTSTKPPTEPPIAPTEFLRFRHLVEMGIVQNWTTVLRWIKHEGFPSGRLVGKQTRLWTRAEVVEWIDGRPTAKREMPPDARRPAESFQDGYVPKRKRKAAKPKQARAVAQPAQPEAG